MAITRQPAFKHRDAHLVDLRRTAELTDEHATRCHIEVPQAVGVLRGLGTTLKHVLAQAPGVGTILAVGHSVTPMGSVSPGVVMSGAGGTRLSA